MVQPQLVRHVPHSNNKFYRPRNILVKYLFPVGISLYISRVPEGCVRQLCPKTIILQDSASFWECELSPEDLGKQDAFSDLNKVYEQ